MIHGKTTKQKLGIYLKIFLVSIKKEMCFVKFRTNLRLIKVPSGTVVVTHLFVKKY